MQEARRNSDGSLFETLLPTDVLYKRLLPLIGTEFENPGNDQGRNRGWGLHQAVSKVLELNEADDDGRFPDIREQLLELKLQTAPSVDLGLMRPNDDARLHGFERVRNCDVRYAVFYGTIIGDKVHLDHLILANGADFFCFFEQMQGNVENTKNQIRLPSGFFDE